MEIVVEVAKLFTDEAIQKAIQDNPGYWANRKAREDAKKRKREFQ